MTSDEYINQRVDNQILWYDNKSATNKKWFIFLKIAEILLALSIPFLGNFITTENAELKYLISFVGVCIAAIAGLLALLKLQENWIEYRTTAETLKHEKYLYLTNSGTYVEENNFERFVERFENLISKENSNWAQYIKHKKEKQNG
jgi:hypothetical protein